MGIHVGMQPVFVVNRGQHIEQVVDTVLDNAATDASHSNCEQDNARGAKKSNSVIREAVIVSSHIPICIMPWRTRGDLPFRLPLDTPFNQQRPFLSRAQIHTKPAVGLGLSGLGLAQRSKCSNLKRSLAHH